MQLIKVNIKNFKQPIEQDQAITTSDKALLIHFQVYKLTQIQFKGPMLVHR